jgi:hypothetical protein
VRLKFKVSLDRFVVSSIAKDVVLLKSLGDIHESVDLIAPTRSQTDVWGVARGLPEKGQLLRLRFTA